MKTASLQRTAAARMDRRLRRLMLRSQKLLFPAALEPGSKLFVGCGEAQLDGYAGCDRRRTAATQLVCRAWEVSWICDELEEIFCRNLFDRFTREQIDASLRDWYQALKVGGSVRIIASLLDVEQLRLLLHDNNFIEIEVAPGEVEFGDGDLNESLALVRAFKRVNCGERQVAARLDDICIDHRTRYALAKQYVPQGGAVLDAACGVGYGSYMLAHQTDAGEVLGLDLNEGAIAYAKAHYAAANVEFQVADIVKTDWPHQHFDLAVSFETIEHIDDAPKFLRRVHEGLKSGGVLICSSPNQERMAFNLKRFPYHVRHYTPAQWEALLRGAGFDIERRLTQRDKQSSETQEGWDGRYNIAVCRKRAA